MCSRFAARLSTYVGRRTLLKEGGMVPQTSTDSVPALHDSLGWNGRTTCWSHADSNLLVDIGRAEWKLFIVIAHFGTEHHSRLW
jgi:hypothetical protein